MCVQPALGCASESKEDSGVMEFSINLFRITPYGRPLRGCSPPRYTYFLVEIQPAANISLLWWALTGQETQPSYLD